MYIILCAQEDERRARVVNQMKKRTMDAAVIEPVTLR
jgi:hypothetical protein